LNRRRDAEPGTVAQTDPAYTSRISLLPGATLGPYEILSPLGSGGMGEVYRARDTKLNRDVAIKVLLPSVADDADRLARFAREAQVLASLNHPNIAQIHGVEDAAGVHALVMEMVEGPTLADRIAAGPIPLDEALPIAKQIAEALEAAHEQGVIHRDLKPANIKVRADGTVKVLDFGLAKAMDPMASSSAAAINSPTLTAHATEMGIILGTAAYMSPEQAKGRAVDRRADIWAFGAVFYEMLSGRRAFQGDDISDTLAAVLRQDLDWSALPLATPPAIRQLIVRCLARDIKKRLRDIGEARILLEDPAATAAFTSAALPSAARPVAADRASWRRALALALTALIALATGAAVVWRLRPAPVLPVMRFSVPLPEGELFSGTGRHVLDVAPDGSHIVFVANGRLYLRSMAERTSRVIAGIDGFGNVTNPVFSPDGRSIVFFAGGDSTLKRIAVTGGAAVTLCPAANPFGIHWGPDGIIFGQARAGIMRVSEGGGSAETIVPIKEGEFAHGPQMLPGGRHVLYTVAGGSAPDRWDKARIVVQELPSGAPKTIVDGGSDARYLTTGHLVYALGGVLLAAPFDLNALQTKGGPVPVVEGVSRATANQSGAAQFDVSTSGMLAYRPGPTSLATNAASMVITDSKGTVEAVKVVPGTYEFPRISPDGRHAVVQTSEQGEAIIWIIDLAGGTTMRRLTFGGNNRFPIWSGDGKYIVFQSDREGDLGIFWQPADGSTTAAQRLTRPNAGEEHAPQSWSRNNATMLYDVTNKARTEISLWSFSLADGKAAPFGSVRTPFQTGAVFSPDSRWVAYAATTNVTTVYVEPFPRTEAKYQLFAKPGDSPHHMTWSPDGKMLYYTPRVGGFEAVAIITTPTFAFGNPAPVRRPGALGPTQTRRSYDVMPDGRFIAIRSADTVTTADEARIDVVLNWFEELRARVPVP
jgi:eukaryotic-like serine/threonine-protein kinase